MHPIEFIHTTYVISQKILASGGDYTDGRTTSHCPVHSYLLYIILSKYSAAYFYSFLLLSSGLLGPDAHNIN